MSPGEKDELRQQLDDLTAQLGRIREEYFEEPSEDGSEPAEEPPAEPPPAEEPPEAPAAPPPRPVPPVVPAAMARSQAESVRAAVAIFVVFFGLGAIVFAWFTMGIDDAQRLAAILLGVIATVVGYYFGQRGATRAQNQAAYAMRAWHSAEERVRELEDWARQNR